MGQYGISQPVTRVEDARLLRGEGEYTGDINIDGQAHAFLLRAPFAHADIRSIDTAGAKAGPGVLGVFTIDDLKRENIGTIPCLAPIQQIDGSPLVTPPRPLLADGRVRHVGQPVALVVAETLDQARDAAEAIAVDYAPLPAVTDTKTASQPGQPQVWDEAPNNICYVWEKGDRAAADVAIETADHVVEIEVVNNRIVVNAMEPRGAVGVWDGDRFTLYAPSQGVHSIKRQLANNIFNMPPEKFHVVTRDVGGGFGMAIFLHPEPPLVLFASRALGRPVKWTGERSADSFLSDTQGRDQVNRAELGLDKDGRFLGLRVRSFANMGAFLSNAGPRIPTNVQMLAGVYTTPAIHTEVTSVFTNTVPTDAFRGAGRPEANYVLERLIDAASRQLGIDAAEIRRRNFIPPERIPYETPMGLKIDSGEFNRVLDTALQASDRDGFAARRAASEADGKLRGLGLAYCVDACGGQNSETATLKVDPQGIVTVLIGCQSNGQGHATAFSQVVADRLGIDIGKIRVIQGDSDLIAVGKGTGGSRSVPVGSVACERGVDNLIAKGKQLAADALEAAEADIEYADGVFSVAGTDRRLDLGALAETAMANGQESSFEEEGFFEAEVRTFPNGCYVCEVEVDRETGKVTVASFTSADDFGTVVNPLLLAGQVHGGLVQGFGQALLEGTVYDSDGQLLSGSMMDYCLPRADDVVSFNYHVCEGIPAATNPLGIKGAGESGAIGAPPAVMNAVMDALASAGVDRIDMPATPESVWRALQSVNSAR